MIIHVTVHTAAVSSKRGLSCTNEAILNVFKYKRHNLENFQYTQTYKRVSLI